MTRSANSKPIAAGGRGWRLDKIVEPQWLWKGDELFTLSALYPVVQHLPRTLDGRYGGGFAGGSRRSPLVQWSVDERRERGDVLSTSQQRLRARGLAHPPHAAGVHASPQHRHQRGGGGDGHEPSGRDCR